MTVQIGNLAVMLIGLGVLLAVVLLRFGIGRKRSDKELYYIHQSKRAKSGGYKKKTLLNKTEQRAYQAIVESKGRRNWLVFAQVSLGEILKHDNPRQYRDVMAKRVDFLITDKQFNPLIVIEINGSGHYFNHAELRDAIKQSALESAGVGYLAIDVDDKQAFAQVEKACRRCFARYA